MDTLAAFDVLLRIITLFFQADALLSWIVYTIVTEVCPVPLPTLSRKLATFPEFFQFLYVFGSCRLHFQLGKYAEEAGYLHPKLAPAPFNGILQVTDDASSQVAEQFE